jgi:biopolymer transport protein ExbB
MFEIIQESRMARDSRRFIRLGISLLFLVVALLDGTSLGATQEDSSAEPTPSASGVLSPDAAVTAAKTTVSSKSLLAVLRSGGLLMIPLGICSVVLLVFVFERLISLRRSRVIPTPLVTRILDQIRDRQLDKEQAIHLCEENPYPVCEVLCEGLRKWGRSSVEVEQAILDSGERVSNELKRNLRVINGVATVTPLLGLLGTVLGMIQAFDAISLITPDGDPKILIASGISEALLTTAAGLSIAIPALIAHLHFSSCVDRRVVEIDAIGLQLVRMISAEGLAEPQNKTNKKVKKAA